MKLPSYYTHLHFRVPGKPRWQLGQPHAGKRYVPHAQEAQTLMNEAGMTITDIMRGHGGLSGPGGRVVLESDFTPTQQLALAMAYQDLGRAESMFFQPQARPKEWDRRWYTYSREFRESRVPAVRVGIPSYRPTWLEKGFDWGIPLLISANALRKPATATLPARFRSVPWQRGIALDSGGFHLMMQSRKRGCSNPDYSWTVGEYCQYALTSGWDWWVSMDYPCEPKLAPTRAMRRRRIKATVSNFEQSVKWTDRFVKDRDKLLKAGAISQEVWNYLQPTGRVSGLGHPMKGRRNLIFGLEPSQMGLWNIHGPDPVPVIQGWETDEYLECAELYDRRVFKGRWPDFIAIGSVCARKRIQEVLDIVDALDFVLPPNVRFHLFGVKGTGFGKLGSNPRVASVDSLAWDYAARWKAREMDIPKDYALRLDEMRKWITTQYRRGA